MAGMSGDVIGGIYAEASSLEKRLPLPGAWKPDWSPRASPASRWPSDPVYTPTLPQTHGLVDANYTGRAARGSGYSASPLPVSKHMDLVCAHQWSPSAQSDPDPSPRLAEV